MASRVMTASSPQPPAPPSASRSAFPIREGELVAMLALLQALHALAIDAMLPALGHIAADLNVADPNKRQMIVGAFLLGLGLGSLVPGAFADRFGRKPVLMFCIITYVLLTAASALTTSMDALIIIRLIQGLVSSGMSVLPQAIIRDKFEGDRMARLQSMIGMIFMIVPMIAPSIGQAIMHVAGWRWIFGVMGIYGLLIMAWVWWRLPETLHPDFRQPIRIGAIARNMGETLTNRASFGYVLGSALLLGVGWGYINSSQQLVAEHFGAGDAFPLIFGGMALSMALSNFTNSRIVERFGARRVSHAALFIYILVTLAQFTLAATGRQTLWEFVVLQSLTMMLMGFVGANFGSISLQPFARIAGAAASVQAFVRMVGASLLGWWIGQSFDGTPMPFSSAALASGLLALVLVLWSEKGRLFRRLHPPGTPRPGL